MNQKNPKVQAWMFAIIIGVIVLAGITFALQSQQTSKHTEIVRSVQFGEEDQISAITFKLIHAALQLSTNDARTYSNAYSKEYARYGDGSNNLHIE
ncbi:hypothetical protein QWJ34_25730 [Saccharibacillus sp. CPCC 101409]|uniref:hypothetical protein n=1 Tax=Saccharibacillus sp. CPCC 101409 TaxID=3058041 RepID=UPI0026736C0B|nr:hypothetical protein [Saccharibacillus sp. CPCC 101409]MDO3413178.1 hypothetical protein [Saccharibacillus sp. CPCC 101409]